ncbi:MAG: hypothetical protein AAGJ35_11500, partial [Myxococcota bacterium]
SNNGVEIDFETPALTGWNPYSFALREKRWDMVNQLPATGWTEELEELGKQAQHSEEVYNQWRDKANQKLQAWNQKQDEQWLEAIDNPTKKEMQKVGLQLLNALKATKEEDWNPEFVKRLVQEQGVDVNETYGRMGAPPLVAVFTPEADPTLQLEKFKLLFELGADPSVPESSLMLVPTGFREAVFGRTKELQYILEHAKKTMSEEEFQSFLNTQGPLNGYSRLIDACLFHRVECVELLLAYGIDTSLAGINGRTAHDAAEGHSDFPKDLLKRLAPQDQT